MCVYIIIKKCVCTYIYIYVCMYVGVVLINILVPQLLPPHPPQKQKFLAPPLVATILF